MKIIHRFILLLVMVLAAQPVYAFRMSTEGIIFLFGGLVLLALLGVIYLGLIITSIVFLSQHRSTPARQKYGKVTEILSYILIFPLPLFVLVMLMASNSSSQEAITAILIACAIAIVPGGLSAFLAHKVKKYPLKIQMIRISLLFHSHRCKLYEFFWFFCYGKGTLCFSSIRCTKIGIFFCLNQN